MKQFRKFFRNENFNRYLINQLSEYCFEGMQRNRDSYGQICNFFTRFVAYFFISFCNCNISFSCNVMVDPETHFFRLCLHKVSRNRCTIAFNIHDTGRHRSKFTEVIPVHSIVQQNFPIDHLTYSGTATYISRELKCVLLIY